MAGITLKPSERFRLGLHLTWNDSDAALDPFELTADEYEAITPSLSFDFTDSASYSALDTSRLEGQLEAKYTVSDDFWLGLWFRHIDFSDDSPYLYDTSGTVQFITAAVGYVF